MVLIFASCHTIRQQGYRRVHDAEVSLLPVFDTSFTKALYAVDIHFGKKSFTSLAIIKQVVEHKSFKLVFLSESGLRLLEMEFFEDGTSKVFYVSDFLNKKALIKKLSSDFNLLFSNPDKEVLIKVFRMIGDDGNYAVRTKNNHRKNYYYPSTGIGPKIIQERARGIGKTKTILGSYNNGGPGKISFTHGCLDFEITLTQIIYPEWN